MMWATITQLDGLPGLPSSRPRRREHLDRLGTITRQRAARGGGVEYLVTDLPEPAQQALAIRASAAIKPVATAIKAGQQATQAAQAQSCATAMAKYGQQLERAGAFDPATNPRLDLFQRFERYHLARGGAIWPCINEFCALWSAGQIDALATTRTAYPALPAKTLDKWYRAWRVNGVEALLERKPRKDKGQSRLAADADLHDVFVAALAEIHDPTARQVRRVIVNQLGEAAAPATSTLKRWLREYKATHQVALLKLKNPDGWRNKFMPALGSRSEHITRVNEEWQFDSTIADAQQRVEVAFNMHDGATGEIRRHALIAGIDVFTRRARVLVARTSSANGVKSLTRTMILELGRASRIKTDNGKDYTADDFDFGLDALGIDHTLCTPFSPEQKPFIERFFGTLLHDLFPMLEGFVGHDVATRKAIESGLSFAERFGHKGVDLHMTPERLQGVIDGWLDEYHNDRVHSELGCTPAQIAERHTTHIVKVDERALDIFMMPVAGKGLRTVVKRGISLGNGWFRAPELVKVIGQQVYCRQDDADLGALYVFDLGGAFICRALDHELLGINRAELAAKGRHILQAELGPQVAALRAAKNKGLAKQAARAIQADRDTAAAAAAPNVARLQPRVVLESTPATASVVTAHATGALDASRAAAQAALDRQDNAQPAVAPVLRLDNPNQRYSTWVRLQARVARAEAIPERELAWAASYETSSEWSSWDELHSGSDPLAEATG